MSIKSVGNSGVVPLCEKLNFTKKKPSRANIAAISFQAPQSLNPLYPWQKIITGFGFPSFLKLKSVRIGLLCFPGISILLFLIISIAAFYFLFTKWNI